MTAEQRAEVEKIFEPLPNGKSVVEVEQIETAAGEVKIEVAPGFGTLNFLGHFCQKNFRERVLEALHAEATEDYFEAVKRGDMVRAQYVKRMMHIWMVAAMVRGAFGWVFGKLSFRVGTGD